MRQPALLLLVLLLGLALVAVLGLLIILPPPSSGVAGVGEAPAGDPTQRLPELPSRQPGPEPGRGPGDPAPGDTALVAGIVVDRQGSPLAGATVTARSPEGAPDLRGETGEDGTFQLHGSRGGEVMLEVTLEGYLQEEEHLRVVAGTLDLVVVMRPGAVLAGRVVSQAGAPVVGVQVQLHLVVSRTRWEGRDQQQTTADGSFRFIGVEAGTARLEVRDAAHGLGRLEVEVAEGEVRTGLELVLEPGLAIRGVVVDEAGLSLADTELHAQRVTPGGHQEGHTATSDEEGRFVFGALEAGVYEVDCAGSFWLGPGRSRVLVPAGTDDLHLVVERGITVRGVVLTPAGEVAALATTRMQLRVRNGSMSSSGGTQEGHFEFTGLHPGEMELVANHQEYAPSEPLWLTLRKGDRIEGLELRLQEGATLTGVVQDAAGHPLEGAMVQASEAAGPGQRASGADAHSQTRGDGAFRLVGLSPGSGYRLAASLRGYFREGYDREPDEAPVHRAGATGIRLVLLRGATISGKVTDLTGHPVPGATLRLRPVLEEGGAPQTSRERMDALRGRALRQLRRRLEDLALVASTDHEGRYEFTGIPPRRFQLTCREDGYLETEPRPLQPAPAEELTGVDLVLDPGVELCGQVVDRDGAPLGDIRVDAEGRDGSRRRYRESAVSGPEGRFCIAGLPPGLSFELQARAEGYGPAPGQVLPVSAFPGAPVTIRLARLGRVVGQVVFGGPTAAVFEVRLQRAVEQESVGELPVDAVGLAPWTGHAAVEGSFPGEPGRFELPLDRDPGPVQGLLILADGYLPARRTLGYLDAHGETDAGTIPLQPGGILLVEVYSPTGEPLEEVRVRARSTSAAVARLRRRISPEVRAGTVPGTYQVTNLDPGEYQVQATHDRYVTVQARVQIPTAGRAPTLRLAMHGGGTIHGQVLDLAGQPWGAISVSAHDQEGVQASRSGLTDGDGRYRLEGLPAGTYEVSCGATRLRESDIEFEMTREVVLPEGGEVRCDLGSSAGCHVQGRLVGWHPGLRGIVQLYSLPGSSTMVRLRTRPARGGTFELERVPGGSYELSFTTAKRQVQVPTAGSFQVDLEVPGGVLAGTLRRADGQEVGSGARVSLRLRRPDGSTWMGSRSAHRLTGEFEFTLLEPGTYQLLGKVHGYGSVRLDGIELAPGEQRTDLVLRVPPGGRLLVSVLDGAGQPVADAGTWLSCRVPGEPGAATSPEVHREEAGLWRLEPLGPGTYRVFAGTPSRGTGWSDAVALKEGGEASVCVVLRGEGRPLRILVTRNDLPVRGARVLLLDQEGELLVVDGDTARGTEADGCAGTGRLPPGTYRVRCTSQGETSETTVTVPTGDGPAVQVVVPLP